jgi:hypothetical protein
MENFPDLSLIQEEESKKKSEPDPVEKVFICVIGAFIFFGGYLYVASTYFR